MAGATAYAQTRYTPEHQGREGMLSPAEQIRFLNDRIVLRHAELARFVLVLSSQAERIARRGQKLKVATIVLGALGVSQGVAAEIFGRASLITSVGFAIVGIAVAAIAGIDAAFKFETRASELRMLAAKCQAARFQHNSEWSYRIAIAEPRKALAAARDLLAVQDRVLSEVQLEAAKLGISIAMQKVDESTESVTDDKREELRLLQEGRILWVDDDLPKPSFAPTDPPGWPPPDSDEG